MYGALGGAVIGAGLGAIIGSLVRWVEWNEVPREAYPVSVRPLPQGGVGLGVSIRF